jgi:hypothetical protein
VITSELMASHKFKIGQMVHYKPRNHRKGGHRGAHRVVRLLRKRENGEPEYRIRNLNEDHERDVKESELSPHR